MFQAFSKYADFEGRASRSEYWLFQLLSFIVVTVALIFMFVGAGGPQGSVEEFVQAGSGSTGFMFGVVILVFWMLAAFVPHISVAVRRFHDHGVSGWWYGGLVVLSWIPYVGWLASIAMLITLVRPGTWGPNYFGPDPVNPWRGSDAFA